MATCDNLQPGRMSMQEAAVTGRDWKRIETELDELVPGAVEAKDRLDQPIALAGRRADDNSILKHIADALQSDRAEIS